VELGNAGEDEATSVGGGETSVDSAARLNNALLGSRLRTQEFRGVGVQHAQEIASETLDAIRLFGDAVIEAAGGEASMGVREAVASALRQISLKSTVRRIETVVAESEGLKYVPPISGENGVLHVPVRGVLEGFLDDPEILKYVTQGRGDDSDVLRDIWDGSFFKNNFSQSKENTHVILISFYQDTYQCGNVLGSRKRNLGMTGFYWVLLNVPSHFRSHVNFIQVYTVVKKKLLKSLGIDSVLAPFVKEMRELGLEAPIQKQVTGMAHFFPAFVAPVIGDALGLHEIGGFVESFSGKVCCRVCLVPRDCADWPFRGNYPLRNLSEHKMMCELVSLNPDLKRHYGVSRLSCMVDLPFFDVTKCLVGDFAHDVLEGVGAFVCEKVINSVVGSREVDLNCLNKEMDAFPYCPGDDKPSPLCYSRGKVLFQQSAAQTWTFILVFPILFSLLLPGYEGHLLWPLIVSLRDVLEFLTLFSYSEVQINFLGEKISLFISHVTSSYPELVSRPKFHFLTHYPSFIRRFGPPRFFSTLRYESKHSYFKGIASRSKNSINLPFTFLKRHQLLQAGLTGSHLKELGPHFKGRNVVYGSHVFIPSRTIVCFEGQYYLIKNIDVLFNVTCSKVEIVGDSIIFVSVVAESQKCFSLDKAAFFGNVYPIKDHLMYLLRREI
jgi:hypothetical protein